jgi:spermidine synthase
LAHRLWFTEDFELHKGRALKVAIKEVIHTSRSAYQEVAVYDTVPFGRMLVLDGVIMVTEYDNHAYHEMIAHVPAIAHPDPRCALVVGGGDGGALGELLKHPSIDRAVICEIDEQVITVCREFFPALAASFADPRVEVVIQDAAAYIQDQAGTFDLICVDSSDPIGPAEVLFQEAFYRGLERALKEEGIAVTQSESMYYHLDFIRELLQRNRKIFPVVQYYYTIIPTYPGGSIGFSFCSKRYGPGEQVDHNRIDRLPGLKYYNTDIQGAAFQLPRFVQDALEQ